MPGQNGQPSLPSSDEIIAILKTRKLQLIPMNDGWIARTIDGSRAGPNHPPYPSPEEAILAAELWFSENTQRDNERKSSRILSIIENADYFIKARLVNSNDDQGNPVKVKRYSAILLDGSETSIVDRMSFIQAVLDMENQSK